jgi:glycosyltransferase involved in cell wall biosynthesis
MRVLFVYKYLTLGGVETVLATRLRTLAAWGIDAHAWFFYDGPGRVIFEDLASQVHIGTSAALHRFLKEVDFTIISSLDTEELFPAFRRLGNPARLVIEAHSPYPEGLEYLRQLGNLPVAAVFVPSQYQVEVVQKRLKIKVDMRMIPNPLGKEFTDDPLDFVPKPAHPIVAWIGRLDEMKNWKEFIEIAAILHRRLPQVECWIAGKAGTDEVEKAFYRRTRQTGLLQRLRWFRGLPYTYMPVLLDAVRTSGGIVVSTSKGDSFGMTVAEGMARGCAVVVPSAGPFVEFVSDGIHGLVYPLGSVGEGADRIQRLLQDDALRSECGLRGRESIIQKHGIDHALEVLASELKQIAERPI